MGPTRPDVALRFDLRRGSSSSPATTSESDCVCVCAVDKLWRVCWKCVIKQTHAPTPLPARAPRSTDKKFLLAVVVAGELEICGECRAPCPLPVARVWFVCQVPQTASRRTTKGEVDLPATLGSLQCVSARCPLRAPVQDKWCPACSLTHRALAAVLVACKTHSVARCAAKYTSPRPRFHNSRV